MIETIIKKLVESPTEELKQDYLNFVNQMEYSLLQDAETLPFKSREYFDKRTEAFTYRRECAMMLLKSWIATYGTSKDCPVNYTNTLNIPFQQIKIPK